MLNYTVAQALELGRNASKGGNAHKHNLANLGNKISDYATRQGITQFADFNGRELVKLVKDMEAKGNKPAYIKHTINAIRLASNYMVDNYDAQAVTIDKRHIPKEQEPRKVWLSFEQLAFASSLVRDSRSETVQNARTCMVVCGLCGLRITEFQRLVPGALEGNRLTIGYAKSDTKNESSKRVIPIPAQAVGELLSYWNQGRDCGDSLTITKGIRRILLRAFNESGREAFRHVPGKDMRKTLPNELAETVDDKWITAYIGHAFREVLHRNYSSLRPRPDDLEDVKNAAIRRLEETVLASVEKKLVELHF